MPSLKTDVPGPLRPYLFHGLDLDARPGGPDNRETTCPFCGKEKKFSVSAATGKWCCRVCQTGTDKGGGNVYTFLRLLWAAADAATAAGELDGLATDRALLDPMTLTHWGVVKSPLTGEWLVPGYGPDGKLCQLYRYAGYGSAGSGGKPILLATPTLPHGLFAPAPWAATDRPTVYLAEGPWDGMALWEMLRATKPAPLRGLTLTGNDAASLLATAAVLALPGCGAAGAPLGRFRPLLAGRAVVLLFDNDHRKEVNGRTIEGAGAAAARRAARVLAEEAEHLPASLAVLAWDPSVPGAANAELADGYDVRDVLSQGTTATGRVSFLETLLALVKPLPEGWLPGTGAAGIVKAGSPDLECLECTDWGTLVTAWRKALRWTEGLDRALSVMLAAVTSTKAVGDQLWVKVIGPASCGKSTLCEALSVNRRYVYAKSTIRGFHSGWKSDKEGTEDHGLVPKLRDKTLVTKDGDTLLQSPNRDQILAEARDLYDSTARVHYRHGLERDHQGVRMTWVLCGTESLRALDHSELGERFLDCVIMEGIDDDLEDEILTRVAHRTERSLALEADGTGESRHEPELARAMQLTGGYVGYLRSNASELLAGVAMDDAALHACTRLGKFVALMRARPSVKQEEAAGREFAARLVSQLVRLAKCLAVVVNRSRVDEEVLRRVHRAALDTARGRTLELVRVMAAKGPAGIEAAALGRRVAESNNALWGLLRFLKRIKVAENFSATAGNQRGATLWRLTPRMERLWEEVNNVAVPGQ